MSDGSAVVGGEAERVLTAAAFLRSRLPGGWAEVRLGLVLGSGLKDFAATVQDPTVIPFADVPHWPVPRVEGHGAAVVVGTVGGTRVACLSGRVHLYEGWSPAAVVRPVRTLRRLGVPAFLLTNAAGGIADHHVPGDLMLLRDHLNLTGSSPLLGPHEPELGPRFPDQSAVWDPALRALLRAQAQPGVRLHEGVYAGLLGPSYETPAEVAMLRSLGADAVGMSTVHEAIALNAMGARLVGLSLISNLAAGIADTPLDHQEVMAAGRAAAATLTTLVTRFCQKLPA